MTEQTRREHLIIDHKEEIPGKVSGTSLDGLSRAEIMIKLRQQIREQFRQECLENKTQEFEEKILHGNSDAIRNLYLEFKRNLELEQKTRKCSARTTLREEMLFLQFEDFLGEKSQWERIQNKLSLLKESIEETLTSPQRVQMRNLINEYREHMQNAESLRQQVLLSMKSVIPSRNQEIAEENNLKNSIGFYLQYVDPTQKAYIETIMNQRLKDLSYEKRTNLLSRFINKLVRISPSIKIAEIDRLMDMADHYLQQNEINSAVDVLEQALLYNPNDVQIYYKLGICYERNGNENKQIEIFHRVLERDPDDYHTTLALAQYYEEHNQIEFAIPLYHRAVQIRPLFFLLLTHFARLTFDNKYWKLAIPALQKVLEYRPSSRKTQRRLGISLIQDEQYDQGIATLKEILRKKENDAIAHLYLGRAYCAKKFFPDALLELENAVKQDSGCFESWFEWIKLLLDCGQIDRAEEQSSMLLHHAKETKIEALLLYSHIARKKGKELEAIRLLEPLVVKGLKNPAILTEYAHCLFQNGQYEESYSLLKDLLKEEKNNTHEIYLLYARTCIHTGHYNEALSYLASK